MKPHLAEAFNTYVLSLPAGDVDGVAAGRGLEPDGYFWEGVVRQLVTTRCPQLADEFTYDSDEASFAAESRNRHALVTLSELLVELIDEPEHLHRLVATAVDAEFMD
jgi:hypothetical protein